MHIKMPNLNIKAFLLKEHAFSLSLYIVDVTEKVLQFKMSLNFIYNKNFCFKERKCIFLIIHDGCNNKHSFKKKNKKQSSFLSLSIVWEFHLSLRTPPPSNSNRHFSFLSSTGDSRNHRDRTRTSTRCCFGLFFPHLNKLKNLLIMGPNNTNNSSLKCDFLTFNYE